METVIEKNIPIPAEGGEFDGQILALEVGDSFSFDRDRYEYMKSRISSKFHKDTNRRFKISASDPKEPETKSRIWRTK